MSATSKTAWGLFLILCILGFLLATQARVQGTRQDELTLRTTDELTTLIGALTRENEKLQAEILELRLVLMDSRHAEEQGSLTISEQQKTLGDLQRATGMVPGYGPGVSMEIADPLGDLDAYELDLLVNELKSAGAEAILINSERLDFRSSFANTASGVQLDGETISRPYVVEAVGNSDSLFSSLVMAGGVVPSLQGRPGVAVNLEKRPRIEVPADDTLPVFGVSVAEE